MGTFPTLEISKTSSIGLRDFYILTKREKIEEDEVAFIPSGTEWSAKDLTVDGVLRNDGLVTIQRNLYLNGSIINNGTIEVGW